MKVADFHNDFLTDDGWKSALKEYERDNRLVVAAAFKGKRNFGEIRTRVAELMTASPKNILLSFEDFGYEAAEREELLSFCPVSVGLTWNGENNLGFGCASGGGLKAEGEKLVGMLNERKIAVDSAHLSRKGFYRLSEIAETLVCTHACFDEVRPHPRNLTREQLEILVERGGMVGLCLYAPFLAGDGEKCDVTSVVRHIDYFAERFGVKNLCLGTDFYGAEHFPAGISDYFSLSALYDALFVRGYTRAEIDGIFFDNLYKFVAKRVSSVL